ncbi:MAG: phosphatase PAP2 family protein [Pseudonocardia sp.]|uniref:bifunctional phosphatase PAP2/diacylglycerol kinase family protein n=1 Tax=unclassified Pseudonocardia TaxID=2619320 RepID=UPI000A41A9ED|nr:MULTISPECIES: bifunctional phosphatase PAP2/diacylglycerol kinase family protein [unclassified Pseudonocardia]MBN9108138.1 phosphatase PAP2 family protein [Pseudonocardia sp.]
MWDRLRRVDPRVKVARTPPLRRIDVWDREISRRIAARPPGAVDTVMKTLSPAANHGVLWFAVAAVLGSRRGAGRKAAQRGVLSIAGASLTANAVLKPLLPRRRPAARELPAYQTIADPPTSSSFPSGHAASAAAFATAVALESPRRGLVVAPLAAAVAYSRVHVGVHWTSDVVVGAALGSGVALLTRRWWPVRGTDEARARPVDSVDPLPDGEGLVMIVNPLSGEEGVDPGDDIEAALPRARVLRTEKGLDVGEQLEEALSRADGWVKAVGVAGGDGTVGAVAAVANRRGLPLVLVPAGTLNHFARDVGVYDLQEAVDASQAGEAVAVDLALVQAHPGRGEDPVSDEVTRTWYFLNTSSIGSYPELVRLREKWQPRWGKWPAFVAALVTVLRKSEKVDVKIEDRWHTVWFLFVGNGPYHPRGMVPAWRPTLDSGLLDVRWIRADIRFSRLRAFLALMLGALGHSKVYSQREVDHLDVELRVPGILATDGEVVEEAGRYTFRVAPKPIPVYRRDEEQWSGRDRPFVG